MGVSMRPLLLSVAIAIASVAACSVVRHPTAAGNCPRSAERVAKVEKLLVIGHRGAAAKEIENTIPSMQRAIADGANAVEIDLSLTKDGAVVLWHDWDPNSMIALSRQANIEAHQRARPRVPEKGDAMRRPIDELTLAEVREHYGYTVDDRPARAEIPTLEQFLDWAATERALAYVVFDMKVPTDRSQFTEPLFQKTLEALSARKPTWGYVFLTPHRSVYDRASAIVASDALSYDVDPGVVLIDTASCDDSSSERAIHRGSGHASTVIPKGIAPEAWNSLQKLLSCDLTARDRASPPRPTKVLVATINDREQMECLLDMGVDGIMADDPGYLRRVTTERGRRP
jgi:glycerophosphoryl diester phosphodiesterase